MADIDGSVLEGGGQILRIALGLSCLLKQPVRIRNIRAGRPKPGLAAQHLKDILENGYNDTEATEQFERHIRLVAINDVKTVFPCVEMLKSMCNASVNGASLGSTQLEFTPYQIKCGKYFADTGTAGSVALLLQVGLPVALFSNGHCELDLKGGTNASMAPQIDYLTEIFRPNLEKFGATFDFDLFKRGYFPKGGGHCLITVNPIKQLRPVTIINFGQVERYFGWSFVAGTLPVKLAQEITDGAKSVLQRVSRGEPIEIESYKESSDMAPNNCSGIILGCETSTGCLLGGSALGSRQERGHETGAKAAQEIEQCVRRMACIDEHIQDQLIIYMALATGVSKIKSLPLSLHTKTAIYVVELMTRAKFNVCEDHSSGTCTIECNGIGYTNNFI